MVYLDECSSIIRYINWVSRRSKGRLYCFIYTSLYWSSHLYLHNVSFLLKWRLWTLISQPSAFKSAQLSACLIPGHSRLQQPAVGLLPQHYLIGEGVSLPELLSAPLSSVGAQPATLMAAAPVRQRSGPAGPRAQLPPCYYEGYLEKRGPKEKVGSPDAGQVPCCFRCMPWIAVVSVNMRSTPADPSIPRELSTSLLCSDGRGETRHWGCWGLLDRADHRFVVL